MSDAYRTSPYHCPICPNSALREFHDRLVCDECQGMQLDADDFAESIREIDGSKDPLDVRDREPSGKPCPHCREIMTSCTVSLGALEIDGGFLRCAKHGLWVPRDAMTAAFARASRRGGFRGLGATARARGFSRSGAAGASDAATAIANMPSGHSGMSGAMASIANAFGAGVPASSGLAISRWESHRPRAHTLFVSAHKDRTLSCPACKAALAYHGERWVCTSCSGAFVETVALTAMITEMTQKPWEMPAITATRGARACPLCDATMVEEVLEGVTIDRCDAHGVWFDDKELEATLHHAGTPPGGLVGWLRQLFGSA